MSYEKFTKNNPIKNELVEILKENYPHLFEDNQISFDKLLKELNFDNSYNIERERERESYGLSWFGKTNSRSVANNLSINTLVPNKELSNNFDNSKNIIIEGDNLEVLKILKNSYFNQVDVIYIDPPYNTGNDFVYNDSFKQNIDEYKINQGLADENGFKTTTNQKTDGRFHTNWLNMIYPRLIIAKQLLKKDGVIFISIDDNEQARLKLLCDEIFGESNFLGNIIWHARRGGGNDAKNITTDHEYILCYSKNNKLCKLIGKLKNDNDFKFTDEFVSTRGKYNLQQFDRASLTYTKSLDYGIKCPDGTIIYPGHVNKDEWSIRRNNNQPRNDWRWMMSEETFFKAKNANFIVFDKKDNKWNVRVKTYQFVEYKNPNKEINRLLKLRSILNDDFGASRDGNVDVENLELKNHFSYPKPMKLIKNILKYFDNKNALILDFFAGSGSTGHAVMDLNKEDDGNRKFILVQLDEKIENNDEFKLISDITRERINRAINKYEYQNQGYKFFKCKSSNIINWNSQNNNEQLSLESINFEEILKEDRSYLDLIYEIGLTMGMKLDSQIEQFDFYFYNKENNMIFLFSDKYKNGFYQIDEIHKIIKNYYELNSDNLQIYLLDCKFKNDEDKLNCLTQIEDISDQIKIVVV